MFVVGTTSIVPTQNDIVKSANVSQYTLALDSENIINSVDKVNVITIGESNNDKESRIVRENQQKAEAAKLAIAQRDTVTRERRVYNDPSDFDVIYQSAESALGVDWRLLKAIHMTETGASGSTMRSNSSGATGPMQFLPSTWRHYGIDGNNDGIVDISNVNDAIFGAANYLRACGYPDVRKALWGYNPSTAYYNKVMSKAQAMGM
ncbi:MAG: lytic transglycosylase domain-containing protein [bacterium]